MKLPSYLSVIHISVCITECIHTSIQICQKGVRIEVETMRIKHRETENDFLFLSRINNLSLRLCFSDYFETHTRNSKIWDFDIEGEREMGHEVWVWKSISLLLLTNIIRYQPITIVTCLGDSKHIWIIIVCLNNYYKRYALITNYWVWLFSTKPIRIGFSVKWDFRFDFNGVRYFIIRFWFN